MSQGHVLRSLSRRTIAVMVGGVLATAVVLLPSLIVFANLRLAAVQAELIAALPPTGLPSGCQRATGGWYARLGPDVEAWGYDGVSLRGAHPSAPALPAALEVALASGQRSAVHVGPLRTVGSGFLAARVAPTGPCGVIGVRWGGADRPERLLFVSLLLAVMAVAAAGLAFAWVVRPLIARLEKVAGLAARVGTSLSAEPVDAVDDEVSQIEAALRRADAALISDRRALEAKTQALERFLMELGHDLKTPLASLKLSVDELVTPTSGEAGRAAMAELLYVEQLVENLRLEARLQQGGLKPGRLRFDLREVVDRIVAGLMPLARRAGVALEAGLSEEPVWLEADRALVERAVSNVVHNAVTHGARNVGVTLQPGGDAFQLEISDDGPGLEASVRSTTRRGEGLGMQIAARALELTGLTITYRPGPDGVGTTATIRPL
ncbi:MAG: HAMP domain-containing sensor histidine kinase [Myxococcales bacterium]|nr:HAMP domain-containing sensor histidine kinase [Myxococcales bacterium]MDP3501077.1 HAMP domain-containing sensor histidine kinase [Myxococcales bacterium]